MRVNWRDIASAPTGEYVLVATDAGVVRLLRRYGDGTWSGRGGSVFGATSGPGNKFTHWMPLPVAPVARHLETVK